MPLNQPDAEYLETLRSATRDTLAAALGNSPKEIIYLDTPRHRNLGDSLIWLGSMHYMQDLGHQIVYHSDMGRFRDRDLRRVSKDAVIVLSGGGNFGDLYPLHDEFRRFVLQTYADRRIILLPQSIYFSNNASQQVAIAEYKRAKNLTILLRESRSLDIASKAMSDLDYRFCYDLALGARLPDYQAAHGTGILTLARADQEALEDGKKSKENPVDWSWSRSNAASWRIHIAIGAAFKRSPRLLQDVAFRSSQYANRRLLDLNMEAAVQQFSRVEAVATDRLHAHVLSILLGIPHVVVDNTYGKISGIYNEYTGSFSTAHWANSWVEATLKSKELAGANVSRWR